MRIRACRIGGDDLFDDRTGAVEVAGIPSRERLREPSTKYTLRAFLTSVGGA